MGGGGHVREGDDVGQLQDRLRRVGRLLFQHVEPGAGQQALPQGAGEGGLIHHAAARGVDQVGAGAHQPQFTRADQVA